MTTTTKRIITTLEHDLKGARLRIQLGAVTVLGGRVNGVGKTASLLAIQLAGTEALVETFDPGRPAAKTHAAIVDSVLVPGADSASVRVGLSDDSRVSVTVAREWKRKRGQAEPVASHSIDRTIERDDGRTPADWRLDDLACGVRALFDESVATRRAALLSLLPKAIPTADAIRKALDGADFEAANVKPEDIIAACEMAGRGGVLPLVEYVTGASNEHAAGAKTAKRALEDAEAAVVNYAATAGTATRESVDAERARLHEQRSAHEQAIGADAQRVALYANATAKLAEARATLQRATQAEVRSAPALERARARLERPVLAEVPADEAETLAAVTDAQRADRDAAEVVESTKRERAMALETQSDAAGEVRRLDGALDALRLLAGASAHVTLCESCLAGVQSALDETVAKRADAASALVRITAVREADAAVRTADAARAAAGSALADAIANHEARQRHNAGIADRAKLDRAERYAAEQAIASHETARQALADAAMPVADAEAEVAALAPGDEVRIAREALEGIESDLRELAAIERKVAEAERLREAVKAARAASRVAFASADLAADVAARLGFKGLAGEMLAAQSAPLNNILGEVYGAISNGKLALRLLADGRPCCDFVATPAGSTVEYPMPMFNGANLAIAETAIQVALMNLRGGTRILVRDSLQDIADARRYVEALVRLVERGLLDQAVVAGCVRAADVATPGADVIDFAPRLSAAA